MNQIKNYFVRNLDVFAICIILESHGQGPFNSLANFCGFIGYGILRGISILSIINQTYKQ